MQHVVISPRRIRPWLASLSCCLWLLPGVTLAATPDNRFDPAAIQDFVEEMATRNGLDADLLRAQMGQIRVNDKVLKYILPPTQPGQRSWQRYQPRFVNDQRINAGVAFWQTHADTLARAEQTYGVPAEIIVAIIGVETIYGRNMGNFKVLEALATLAFEYPPRAPYFRSELEQFLLLAKENDQDALSIRGSYAGAIGIPQFMPGSQRRFAVDFDGDGKVDLRDNAIDAIGSVGSFLKQHGWTQGGLIAAPIEFNQDPDPSWVQSGMQPKLKTREVQAAGRVGSSASLPESCSLVDLVTPDEPTEYWLGFDNFYAITRYNRSTFYAMSVLQLAEAVRARRELVLSVEQR